MKRLKNVFYQNNNYTGAVMDSDSAIKKIFLNMNERCKLSILDQYNEHWDLFLSVSFVVCDKFAFVTRWINAGVVMKLIHPWKLCVCVCLYIYIYIYICVCVCVCVCVYLHVRWKLVSAHIRISLIYSYTRICFFFFFFFFF